MNVFDDLYHPPRGRSLRIKKAARLAIAHGIAEDICRVFGIRVPDVAHGSHQFDRDSVRNTGDIIVTGMTGRISLTIDVSPRLISVFGRLASDAAIGVPLTAAETALARLVGGNEFSGKVNLQLTPEPGADGYTEPLRAHVVEHLRTLRYGTRIGRPS